LKQLKQKLDCMLAVAYVTYKEWSAYRTHSLVSVFVGPMYFAVQYFIWRAVYAGANTLNGMDFPSMLRYFGASALIGYLVMDFADWNLSMLIRTGKYLTFAMRPLNHRFFAFSQKVGHRVLGFLAEFVPCLLIFVFIFKVDMRPAYPGWAVLSVILAFFMNFLVNYCIGMMSFWIVQTEGIRQAYSLFGAVFAGTLVPLSFFPMPLQIIQFFLPFQYTSYVPAMVFLGGYRLGGLEMSVPVIVGVQGAAVILMFIVSEVIYNAAIKRFTAVGA